MARLEGETSNAIFDDLAAWESYLKAEKINLRHLNSQTQGPRPPQPVRRQVRQFRGPSR